MTIARIPWTAAEAFTVCVIVTVSDTGPRTLVARTHGALRSVRRVVAGRRCAERCAAVGAQGRARIEPRAAQRERAPASRDAETTAAAEVARALLRGCIEGDRPHDAPHLTPLRRRPLLAVWLLRAAEEEEGSAAQASSDPQSLILDPCVLLPHIPDLSLESFSVVEQGGSAHMIVTLRNRGCAASPPIGGVFAVSLVGGSSGYATWTPNSSYGVPPNGIPRNATQTFNWDLMQSLASVQGLGGHWHLVLDPNNTIAELSESNNVININNP